MKKKIIAVSVALLLIGASVGAIAILRKEPPQPQPERQEKLTVADGNEITDAPFDSECYLTVKRGEAVETMDMESYLIGVVAAEMPASFEFEALCAQSVAARTYTIYKMRTGCANHPEADACDDITCCKAYSDIDTLKEVWGGNFDEYYARIKSAVNLTDGVVVTYASMPILAAFHSSSGGRTADSGEVWGKSLPYLTSVESPETEEDVPNYISEKTVSFDDFRRIVAEKYPAAQLDGGSWIEITSVSASGRVESVDIGGVSVSGSCVRNMFDLRSTMFTAAVGGDGIVFTTAGFGHGVGLSQYGANVMAKNGARYDEILAEYYTGTTLTKIIMD